MIQEEEKDLVVINENLDRENLKLQIYIDDLQEKLKEIDQLKEEVHNYTAKMGALLETGVVDRNENLYRK